MAKSEVVMTEAKVLLELTLTQATMLLHTLGKASVLYWYERHNWNNTDITEFEGIYDTLSKHPILFDGRNKRWK